MNADQIPLFSLLAQKMSWLSARQSVLAQNVANANTPGYAAHDIKALDFQKMMLSTSGPTSLNTTSTLHISANPVQAAVFEPIAAEGEEGSEIGNGVSLEKEVMKLSETQIQYQAATNLYRKAVNMFHIALGGRS